MLKQKNRLGGRSKLYPAAFRRLCVETLTGVKYFVDIAVPAAFRRLCVETSSYSARVALLRYQPPSGGCVLKHVRHIHKRTSETPAAFRRLCVETPTIYYGISPTRPAAFRRLCVETRKPNSGRVINKTSRLQAAVC